MHIVLTLLRKDFARLRRDKAALSLTFLVPFVLMILFGAIFGANSNSGGPAGIPLAVVNASDNPGAAGLLAALRAEKTFRVVTDLVNPDKSVRPLQEADLEPLMRANEFRFAVVIPRDLVSETEFGVHLKIFSNPRNEIETQIVNGILQKTIFSHVPQLLGQSLQERARRFLGGTRLEGFNRAMAENIARNFGGDPDKILAEITAGNFGLGSMGGATGAGDNAGDFLGRMVRIESKQVIGREVKSPMVTRSIGGWAMQFLLFAVTASATALFYEKEQGLFQRLLSAPASRAHILWSKFLYGVVLGLVQLVVLFIAGQFLYGLDVTHHLGLLVLVCIFAAAACTAFGLLLASIVPTPEAARGLSTLVILLMSALGGAWFPPSIMPEIMQRFSKLTLVYWAMEGFQQVLWANCSLLELLPTLALLGGIAAVVMGAAVWRFNRGAIFD